MSPIKDYSVAAVKKIRGHDGQGYSCTLMRLGKKVAHVFDDGWGGGLQIDWLDKTPADVKSLNHEDKEITFKGTLEQAMFHEQVMKMPKIQSPDFPDMSTNVDIVIDDMASDALTLKKIASDLKKNFVLECIDGKILTWKITATHTIDFLKTQLLKKYPSAKVLNDLPASDVYEVYKKANLIG